MAKTAKGSRDMARTAILDPRYKEEAARKEWQYRLDYMWYGMKIG
jgi:hypothetical protein